MEALRNTFGAWSGNNGTNRPHVCWPRYQPSATDREHSRQVAGGSARGLHQFAQFIQILRTCISDDKIAQAVVTPASQVERECRLRDVISPHILHRSLLKNKDRNLVLPHANN